MTDNDVAKRMAECTKYGTDDCCFRPDCPHVKQGMYEYEVEKKNIFL